MKSLRALCIFLLCLAGGALTHHLMEALQEKPETKNRIGNPALSRVRSSRSQKEIAGLVDELFAWRNGNGGPEWAAMDDKLSSIQPEEVPFLLQEVMRSRGDIPWNVPWDWRNDLGVAVLEYATEINPKAVLAFAGEDENHLPLESVLRQCSRFDPEAVVAVIRALHRDPGEDDQFPGLLNEAFGDVSESDPAGTLAMADRNGFLDGKKAAACFAGAAMRWRQSDPAAALSFAEKHPSLLGAVLQGWASEQPDAALEWLRARPGMQQTPSRKERREPDFEGTPIERGLSEYVRNHPEDADRFAGEFHDKEDFYTSLAAGMAQAPVQEVAAWLKTLPEDFRPNACTAVMESLGSRDPPAAASLCALLPELPGNASFLFEQWAGRDPVAASKFLQSGALTGEVRNEALPGAVRNWLVQDRAAAMEFIRSQPPSEVMGRVLLESSAILTEGDSESARDLAMTYPDVSQRIGACRRILETEFNSDGVDADKAKAAALKWIDSIPDAAVRKVLTPMP